jgi:hypothetical protein
MLVLGGGSRFPDSPSAIIVADESWKKMRPYWRRAGNKTKVQESGSQKCMLILLHENPLQYGSRSRVRPLYEVEPGHP